MAVKMADFKKARTRGEKVSENIKQATGGKGSQPEAGEEEKAARALAGRTQGRKGCKAARINMAFTPENYEFIQFTSHYKGMNLTKFVNLIIEQYRTEHEEAYRQAKDLAKEL